MKSISMTLEQLLPSKQSKLRAPVLGERELDVMKTLWSGDALSAQEVLQASGELNLSLSTIQSTLERLYRKELVSRQKTGRFYLYRAMVSRTAVISQLLGDIAEQFGEGDKAPVISGFMSFIGQDMPMEHSSMENSIEDTVLKTMQSLSNKEHG